MPPKRSIRKRLLIAACIILLLVFSGIIAFHYATRISPPSIKDRSALELRRIQVDTDFYRVGNSWLRKSRSGLYELYVEGDGFDRGVMNGKLTKELIYKQENAFVKQLGKMIPSHFYQRFLRYFVAWFDRDLDGYLKEEYKEEIYGISFSASDKFSWIGSNYERILNYHAAHDIGHALQDLALVGCTSFSFWDGKSQDSSLVVARNFDFYMGEEFAADKIVCFIHPDSGYNHMFITWGGMIGAVSGMNEKGLTVTINAAKSKIPYSAKTPISLVSREILQYASTIEEAYQIAKKRKTFVSESIMIGSSTDNQTAIIEKSPFNISLLRPESDQMICANHYRSKTFENDRLNKENIRNSASQYRFQRVEELMASYEKLNISDAAVMLRDQQGQSGRNIGMGNEKAINQLIAHHSVIFKPASQLVWVSTSPFQLGPYVCYDLNQIFRIFANLQQNREITVDSLQIPADPFLFSHQYQSFREYRELSARVKEATAGERKIDRSVIDRLVHSNPAYYFVHILVGDYFVSRNDYRQASVHYQKALQKEIPNREEVVKIRKKLDECRKKLVK